MQPGRWFAAAAVLVTAPRLVLAFLAADAMPLAPAVRAALLTVSSVSTAIALTGGAAYLAHTLASAGRARPLLQALWLAILVCSSALRVCACGRSFAKQQSFAAHRKSCPRRP